MKRAAATVLGLALSAAGSLAAQTTAEQLSSTAERLAAAEAAQLTLISPRNMERASEEFARAQAEQNDGRIDRVESRLRSANDALQAAESLEPLGLEVLGAALAARSGALAANAPAFAGEEWTSAERRGVAAGRALESGDQAGAGVIAAEAAGLYRTAELVSVRSTVLGEARELRARALTARAEQHAPETLGDADELQRRAAELLGMSTSRSEEARELAERAAAQYRHALWIAVLADSVRNRDLSTESLIERHEAELAAIADQLGIQAEFSGGTAAVGSQAQAAIRSVQDDRSRLEQSLAGREARIDSLEAAADSLRAELARLGEREATATAELRERQQREQRLREVRALFDSSEAEVLVGIDRITIRTLGLTFDSGSDEIRPEDYSLLTKLQQAIRAFPDSEIIVEGHTDSQGNDEFNRALSQRRAIAVREYLLANMAISADRIRSIGYGESRPIASNDSEEGRARNRRIDVILELAGEG